MDFVKLDNEELLRLSLDAMNNGRDADSVIMLKTLLEREPGNVYAQYLLAAQHAQLGMMDRAEEEFRKTVEIAPELVSARFQLGQLLLLKGELNEARQVLNPLTVMHDALGAYARGLCAAGDEDVAASVRELEQGMALPQPIPALALDMKNLRDRLLGSQSNSATQELLVEEEPAIVPRFLGAYQGQGRH
ncbi:hypothetical protein EBB59_02635 [Lysobacter pythonis]|uniref:Uncharacterized protein n=1 Tax=Solilutibacter pythonis TaxID=2483112 RepID=A0A3M2HYF2_9GAMM|nr:tetratricopeptide repeat protein [Lysobacter pythonis]RMH94078.1 hypothetical protein EBB59_02635 [Lysobacter pythonis]